MSAADAEDKARPMREIVQRKFSVDVIGGAAGNDIDIAVWY